jgi:uncharacterized membrane protein
MAWRRISEVNSLRDYHNISMDFAKLSRNIGSLKETQSICSQSGSERFWTIVLIGAFPRLFGPLRSTYISFVSAINVLLIIKRATDV